MEFDCIGLRVARLALTSHQWGPRRISLETPGLYEPTELAKLIILKMNDVECPINAISEKTNAAGKAIGGTHIISYASTVFIYLFI